MKAPKYFRTLLRIVKVIDDETVAVLASAVNSNEPFVISSEGIGKENLYVNYRFFAQVNFNSGTELEFHSIEKY